MTLTIVNKYSWLKLKLYNPNNQILYSRINLWLKISFSFQVRTYYDNNFAAEEIPYLNTDGDLNRMNALFQQLPKQDLDAHFCTALKYDREIKYNQFMNMRNSKYFDVGIPRLNEKFPSLVIIIFWYFSPSNRILLILTAFEF